MIIVHSEQIPYRGFIKNTEPSIKKDVEGAKKKIHTQKLYKKGRRENRWFMVSYRTFGVAKECISSARGTKHAIAVCGERLGIESPWEEGRAGSIGRDGG